MFWHTGHKADSTDPIIWYRKARRRKAFLYVAFFILVSVFLTVLYDLMFAGSGR